MARFQHKRTLRLNDYSRSNCVLLFVLIALGVCVAAVKCFPYPKHYIDYPDDGKFSTMESSILGKLGRAATGTSAPKLTGYAQMDNLIRQRTLVGSEFMFSDAAMTAGDIFSNYRVEWANVTRAYFGSYVEKLLTKSGCHVHKIGVTSPTSDEVIILAPEQLDALAYLKAVDMEKGEITVCFNGSGDTMVWVIPNQENLIYRGTEDIVRRVGSSEYGVNYTSGHVYANISGGCVVIPFGFEMSSAPYTFVSVQSDKEYVAWVQDVSTDGFMACFNPTLATESSVNVTLHYVAASSFDAATSGNQVCAVSLDVHGDTSSVPDEKKVLEAISKVADTSNGYLFNVEYKLGHSEAILSGGASCDPLYPSDSLQSVLKSGNAPRCESARIIPPFNIDHFPKVGTIIDAALEAINTLLGPHGWAEVGVLCDGEAEEIGALLNAPNADEIDFEIMRMDPCGGLKSLMEAGTDMMVEVSPIVRSICDDDDESIKPHVENGDNDYSTPAVFVGDLATATSLNKSAESLDKLEIVHTNVDSLISEAPFGLLSVPISSCLLLLFTVFMAFF